MEYSQNNLQIRSQRIKKIFKAMICLFILGAVSSCGSNFLYNLIDTILVRSIDQYFDLNGEQKRFLKERLEYKLHLYRTDGIPEHIVFIKGIQKRVQKGLNRESINWFIQEMTEQFNLVMNTFSGDLVEFLMTLSEEQIDYFERKLAEQNEKLKKRQEKLSEKQTEDNPEDVIHSLEKWLGPLNDIQKKEILLLLHQMAAEAKQQDNPEQNYTERLERQQEFIRVLRNGRKNREQLEKALYEIIDPVRAPLEDESTALFMDYVLKIDQIITLEQRTHFIKKLDSWIHKLEVLIDP